MTHDDKLSGHFPSSKTLARLEDSHWKGKVKDVEDYCKACRECQQKKDGGGKK